MKLKFYTRFLVMLLAFVSCTEDGTLSETDTTDSPSSFSSESGGGDPGTGSESDGGTNEPDRSGIVTAGEWNDLDNWSFWQNLLNQEIAERLTVNWKFNTANRFSFKLMNASNQPLVDAVISIKEGTNIIWEARTDNRGTAELWVDLKNTSNQVKAAENYVFYINDNPVAQAIKPYSQGINTIQIATNTTLSNQVDLSFIVDATGSMGDEMDFLKDDLKMVIQKVSNAIPNLQISTGTVFYRDEGDEYVVKKSDFTSNLQSTLSFINDQHAEGGGDFPEAVHSGLKTGINELQWSSSARTRIAFLLLDAPPHNDTQIIDDIHTSVKRASAKGIKIIPIVASGINKETEFLMRNLSISTNGTYVFITNDSGVGNDHLEPTVGEYEVELLQDLLIRLIKKYSL